MVKNGLVISPKKYGVYTGTKEADKKTSGKVISNFEKYVNYIAGWNYHLGDRFAMQAVLCSSIWHIGSFSSVPNKVVKN